MSRPRIRTIKPEMFADEAFGTLSHQARLLFIGLITMSDDEGRLRALPAAITGHIFPYDDVPLSKLKRWIEELVNARLIVIYEADGLPYAWLPGWAKHQRVNRLTPSTLPPPPAARAQAPASSTNGYKKAAIPEKVRRAVALREGAVPGETTPAKCHYCEAPGKIVWARLASGRAGSWVQFTDLELDHVHPEFHGGPATEDNIVLACRSCNRRKAHGMSTVPAPGPEWVSAG